MGTEQAIALVGGIVIAIAALGALAAGSLTATEVETNSDGAIIDLPTDSSHAVVVATYQTKAGFGLLGINFTPSRWAAQVMLVPPPGCAISFDEEITATGDCAGIAAEGRASASGTGPGGPTLWNVEFEVSKACHEALRVGERWPTSKPPCQ